MIDLACMIGVVCGVISNAFLVWWTKWRRKKSKTCLPGDYITEWEKARLLKGVCPDCETAHFPIAPPFMVTCGNEECGSRYIVWAIWGSTRASYAQPNKRYGKSVGVYR